MNQEFYLGLTACVGLLFNVVGSFLYMWGGRQDKWVRRYLGSFVIAGGVTTVALMIGVWKWQLILLYPLIIFGMVQGYGGDTIGYKIVRRLWFLMTNIFCGLLFIILAPVDKVVLVFLCQIICGISSIVLGIKNPLPAAVEEVLVCTVLYLFITSYPFLM